MPILSLWRILIKTIPLLTEPHFQNTHPQLIILISAAAF